MKRVLFLATLLMAVVYGVSFTNFEIDAKHQYNIKNVSRLESDLSYGSKSKGILVTAISATVSTMMATTRLAMRNIFIPVQRVILMLPKMNKRMMELIIQRLPISYFFNIDV